MRAWLIILVSVLGCGEDPAALECDPGFVKMQGRWCVFDEEAIAEAHALGGDEEDEPSEDDPDTEDQDEPSEYVYEPPEQEELLSLAEIEAEIEQAIRTVQGIDPAPVHAIYRAVQEDGDVGCPNYDEEEYESSGLDYWRDACTVGASAAFSGYVYSRDRGEWVNGAYAYTHDAYYRGSARMVDARGYVFVGAGYSNHSEYTNTSTGDVTVYSSLNGNFRTDDPAYAGTWLAQDLNVSVYTSAVDYAEDEFITDGFSMVTSASLSGIDGVINALRLNNLYMYSESIGSPCEIEPSGSVEIRDNAGHWYQIHFQGPEYAGAPTFPPDCDACGPVYFHGELLGEVCPDFSDLGAWEVRPW